MTLPIEKSITKSQDAHGRTVYVMNAPHAPEIPAFERKPLRFFVTEPKCGVSASTVPILCIGGRGFFNTDDYMVSVHKSLSEKRDFLVISVDFLGIHVPHDKNRVLQIDDWCLLQTNLEHVSRGYPPLPLSSFDKTKLFSEINTYLKSLPQELLDGPDALMHFTSPTPNEHEDFGLVQAADCLTAIGILKKEFPQVRWQNLVGVGQSHGAYLVTQCSRFAPNTFALVINDNGWTGPTYEDIIRDVMSFTVTVGDIKSLFHLENYWRLDPGHPFYLSQDRIAVRDQNDGAQLTQWRQHVQNGPHYVFIQQSDDRRHPKIVKNAMIAKMRDLKFSLEYFRGQEDCETKLRTFEQGDKTSLKGIVYDFVTEERLQKNPVAQCDFARKSRIAYVTPKSNYTFDFSGEAPRIEIKHS